MRSNCGVFVFLLAMLASPARPASKAAAVPAGVFIDEVESNDSTATAQPLPPTPVRVRGNLYRVPFVSGVGDEDVYSLTAAAGDRLSAAAMTSWSSGHGNTILEVIASDGTTVLESDGNTPFGASKVAGVLLPASGTYYVRLRQAVLGTLHGTIRPYDLHVQVQRGAPSLELEPNGSIPSASPLPATGWVRGTVGAPGDLDWFSFTAEAGDTVVAILDLDPERDATDWDGRLGLGLFGGYNLIDNGPSSDAAPAEARFMTVRTSGTSYVYVDEATLGGAPGFTYHLSVHVIPTRHRACARFAGTTGPIADLAETDFRATVGDARRVGYLMVDLTIAHADVDNLDVSLVSPGGNEVALFDERFIALPGSPEIDYTFEDEAGFPDGRFHVYSGMHYSIGAEVSGRLDFFAGMDAQSTWTLRVHDDAAGVTGTVIAWGLRVCPPDPQPSCLSADTPVFATDFESDDAGFTHGGAQDEWERGRPSFPPITTAHSGSNAFKTDLDGTYNANADNHLRSPVIVLPASGRITLAWWQKYQMDIASQDTYWVEVREAGNPASARRVFSWLGGRMIRPLGNPEVVVQQSAGWGLVEADVSAFAGRSIEVEFHLDSDPFDTFAGVAIDDFAVTACAAPGPLASAAGPLPLATRDR